MNEYRETITAANDSTANDPTAEARATLSLSRRSVELARFIDTNCKGPGVYIIELGLSKHKSQPMRVEIAEKGVTRHLTIEK
jgi:hypothetical protein